MSVRFSGKSKHVLEKQWSRDLLAASKDLMATTSASIRLHRKNQGSFVYSCRIHCMSEKEDLAFVASRPFRST
jgi:hypothetical protein